MRFQDIPSFTRHAVYHVDIGLDYLPNHYARYILDYNLDVSPDFQRGNVWTETQKIRFMEYFLRGGASGSAIYLNIPSWNRVSRIGDNEACVLVDGKQRLDAALGFLNNEFPVFGHYYREFTDRPSITQCNFHWYVNDLQTREECLQWYLDMNSGGTVHAPEDLDRVRKLLTDKVPYSRPPQEELLQSARIDRECLRKSVEEIRADKARYEANEEARRLEALNPLPVKKARTNRKGR